jgi:hypothetical protein
VLLHCRRVATVPAGVNAESLLLSGRLTADDLDRVRKRLLA